MSDDALSSFGKKQREVERLQFQSKATPRTHRVAANALRGIAVLPEKEARKVVRFLALLYLNPADCREIIQSLES